MLGVASRAVGTGIALSAAFAPVPWLAPAVGVLLGIMQMCENVSTNKRAIKQLGNRCEAFLLALKDENLDKTPEAMQQTVETCVERLEVIRGNLAAWSNLSKIKNFILQDDVLEGIKRCHEIIDQCITAFKIKSHMEIHVWQAEFAANQKRDHQEVLTYLTDIQNKQDITNIALQSQTNEISALMAFMQAHMKSFEIGDRRHQDLQSNLYNVQSRSKQLLPVVDLRAGEVRRIGNHPVGGTPAFDIWEGLYLGQEKCAIKVIRGVEVSERTIARFSREVEIWREVYYQDQGEYILPFYGICHVDGPYPYMVSPWMQHGDALNYVRKYPHVNRKRLIRRIAEGLRLLHTQTPPIAHSDIKAANILINGYGNPLLADFGLSKVMEDITGMPFTQSRGVSDSYRWFAPELCCSPGIISTRSDIFSFSMAALELLTGEHPFSHIRRTPEVLIRMQQGERPVRPTNPEVIARGLDDNMWHLFEWCWNQDPDKRPTVHQVLEVLPQA